MANTRFYAFQDTSPRRPGALSFRPIEATDLEFLASLYASTRAAEMAVVDWSDEQKQGFLRQQFEAQHQYYQQQFIHAQFLLIQMDGKACGRVYLDRREQEIRLIDIALIEGLRGQGIGSALMEEILTEAVSAGLPVRLHVEQFNPAFRLYQRLGFQVVEDQGVYLLMQWLPGSKPTAS